MFSPNATENRVKKGKGKKTNVKEKENRKAREENGGKRGSRKLLFTPMFGKDWN